MEKLLIKYTLKRVISILLIMGHRYDYFKEDKDREFVISSMKKYVSEKQELDKSLELIISPLIKGKSLRILDACCGIGHIAYFLSEISPSSHFLGVDQTPYLIEEAKKLCFEKKNISFEIGDIYDLPKKFDKSFDITINWKTISWLPYYDEFMKSLFKITKKHIFLSSLFYDGDIDFEIKVREFKKEGGKDDFNSYYNVYSFPKFERFVKSLNCKKIHYLDFDLPFDIPRVDPDFMGTYTLKLHDGRRIQISGAVIMSWKIVNIEL